MILDCIRIQKLYLYTLTFLISVQMYVGIPCRFPIIFRLARAGDKVLTDRIRNPALLLGM